MKLTVQEFTFATIAGTIGGFIANLFGGWSADLITLIICMIVDYIMGIIIAGVLHKSQKSQNGALSSSVGWVGLCRKGVILLIVLIAHRLDITLGVDYIKTAVIIGFITNEIISILENAGIMGVPLPDAIYKAIDMLKGKDK